MSVPTTTTASAAVSTSTRARIQQLMSNASSTNTKRAYLKDWNQFSGWCIDQDQTALPAAPATVAAYVVHLRDTERRKYSTIQRKVSAISKAHTANGHNSPARSNVVSELLKGLRRETSTDGTKQAPALRLADVERVCIELASSTSARATRDRAALLVGFFGAFRRSEIAALTWENLTTDDKGVTVLVERSKTDQDGKGTVKVLPYRPKPDACPVRALNALQQLASSTSVFPEIRKGDNVTSEAMSARAVDRIVKRYFGQQYSAHSLRAGFVTEAAAKGATHQQIMTQSGHKDVKTVQRYTRFTDAWEANAATLL